MSRDPQYIAQPSRLRVGADATELVEAGRAAPPRWPQVMHRGVLPQGLSPIGRWYIPAPS